MRVVREGDDHALDVEAADDRRESLCVAEQREVLEILRRSFGSASTKPTRFIPYSGWLRSFLATSCPTSPAPTMTVFWI